MRLNDANEMTNGVDYDQIAPSGAVWSGSILFYSDMPVKISRTFMVLGDTTISRNAIC